MSVTNTWLREAVMAALQNPIEHLPRMAAVLLTRDGRMYYGMNKLKTHPLQAKFGRNEKSIYLHAEIDAIAKAAANGSPVEDGLLYVARVMKNGIIGLAKPCIGCQRAIMHFNLSHVEWTE